MKKLLLSLVIISIALSTGCGKKEEKTSTGKDSASVTQNQQQTITAPKSDTGNKNNNSGLDLKNEMPADFPKDVPHPPNSTHKGVIYSATDGNAVTFISKAKPMEIAAFYKDALKKADFKQEEGEKDMLNEKGGMLKWTKPSLSVELMMSWKETEKETDVVISYKK